MLGCRLRHNLSLLQQQSTLLGSRDILASPRGLPQRPLGQPQAILLKPVAAVPPAPVIDLLRSSGPLQALELQRHVAPIVQPYIIVEFLPDIVEGRLVVREADVLQDVWCLSREAIVIDGIEDYSEDILQHLCLGHFAIAYDCVTLEGRVEPYPHLACLIDADHLLIHWKEADYLAQLPKSTDTDIQQVDHIRIRHILHIRQPQRHWLNDHLLCISRWLLDWSFAQAVASLASV